MWGMWRKNHQKDIVIDIVYNEFVGNVTVISIAYEKMIFPRSYFSTCFRIKTSFKSCYPMFIACSSFWVFIKPPVAMNIHRNSFMKQIFHFENDKRRNNTFIDTNTLHHCDSFLTPRLCLKLLTNDDINNTSLCLLFIDSKSILIHVIDIFQLDIIFH